MKKYTLLACLLYTSYPVPASAYHNGWARGGGIKSDSAPYGLPLE